MTLPDHYPFADAPLSDLLRWAHSIDPPLDKVRTAAPWLTGDGDARAYLDGVIQGNIRRWRHGTLFSSESR